LLFFILKAFLVFVFLDCAHPARRDQKTFSTGPRSFSS
jgi:hypothetical protein